MSVRMFLAYVYIYVSNLSLYSHYFHASLFLPYHPTGQEVSICYLGLNDDKIEERIDHLKFTYGFVCTCLRCQLERAALDGEEGEEKKKNEGAAGLFIFWFYVFWAFIFSHFFSFFLF